jgi:hypothetical protein
VLRAEGLPERVCQRGLESGGQSGGVRGIDQHAGIAQDFGDRTAVGRNTARLRAMASSAGMPKPFK